jgi:RecA-family ATPase
VLTDREDVKALLEAIQRQKPARLIFVDTLHAVTPGSDENSSQDMGLLLDACKLIHRKTGAMVLLIHHKGKTIGKGMRGHSSLPAAMEVIWEITADETHHKLHVEKVKNAERGSVYEFRLLPVGKSCVVEWI